MKNLMERISKKALSTVLALAVILSSLTVMLPAFAAPQNDEPYLVTDASPAIPIFKDNVVSLSDLTIEFADGEKVSAAAVQWELLSGTNVKKLGNNFFAEETGITVFKATYNGQSKNIYAIANEKNDYDFVLAEENLKEVYDKNEWSYHTTGYLSASTTPYSFYNSYFIPKDVLNSDVDSTRWTTNTNGIMFFPTYFRAYTWIYKSEILKDFGDYEINATVKHGGNTDFYGYTQNHLIVRATLDETSGSTQVLKSGTTPLGLGYYRTGGLHVYKLGDSAAVELTGSATTTVNTLTDASLIGSSTSDVSYVWKGDGTGFEANLNKVRNIKYTLQGNRITYSMDGNLIFDSDEEIKTSASGTVSPDDYSAFMDGVSKKGTIGFSFVSTKAYLQAFSVSLVGITADTMPKMTDADFGRTIKTGDSVISMLVGDTTDLSNVIIQFKDGSAAMATDATWTLKNGTCAEKSGNSINALSKGVAIFEVSYGTQTLDVTVIINETGTAGFYTVKDSSPAIPMFKGKYIDLSEVIIEFGDGLTVLGSYASWTLKEGISAEKLGNNMRGLSTGLSKFEVTYGSQTRNVYVIVNEVDDYDFVLEKENLKVVYDANEWSYHTTGYLSDSTTPYSFANNYFTPKDVLNADADTTRWTTGANGIMFFPTYFRAYTWMYKSEILKDFGDYEINATVKHGGSNTNYGYTQNHLIVRATLDETSGSTQVLKSGTTPLGLGYYRTGGLHVYKLGDIVPAELTGSATTTVNTLTDASLIGSSTSDVSYVWKGDGTGFEANNGKVRNVKYTLKGNHITYSMDGNLIFDSSKEIKTSASGTVSADEYNAFMDGASKKGTIGFSFVATKAYLQEFKVSLVGIDANSMPTMKDDNLEVMKDAAPATPMFVGESIDLNNIVVLFNDDSTVSAAQATWTLKDGSAAERVGDSINATARGVAKFEVTYGTQSITVYFIVNESGAADFYTVEDSSPAIPMFKGKYIDLNDVIIEFGDGSIAQGSSVSWKLKDGVSAEKLGNNMRGLSTGISKFEVTYGSQIRNVYVIINNVDDYNFVLAEEDLKVVYDANEWSYHTTGYLSDSTTPYSFANNYFTPKDVLNADADTTRWKASTDGLMFFPTYFRAYTWMYKSDVLKDFGDYEINATVKHGGNTDFYGYTQNHLIVRATLDETSGSTQVLKSGTTPLGLGYYRTGGLHVYKLGDIVPAELTGSATTTVNTLTDASLIGSSTSDVSYVWKGDGTGFEANNGKVRNVKYTLKGNHITYSMDGNLIFDSSKEIKTSASGTISADDYNAFMNGVNRKGTIGFSFVATKAYLQSFKVSLVGVDVNNMPAMKDDNLRAIKDSSPATPMFVGESIDLNNIIVLFNDDSTVSAAQATWTLKYGSAAERVGDSINATARGISKFEVSYGTQSIIVYFIVNETGAADFYTINDTAPALPIFKGKIVDLRNVIIEFSDGEIILGSDATWTLKSGTSASKLGKSMRAPGKGVTTFEVSYGSQTRNVYVIANEVGDYNFKIVDVDLSKGGYVAEDWVTYFSNTAVSVDNNIDLSTSVGTSGWNGNPLISFSTGIGASSNIWGRTVFAMYKSDVLKDFSDYTVDYTITNMTGTSDSDDDRGHLELITRATLNENADSTLVFDTTKNMLTVRFSDYGGIRLYNTAASSVSIMGDNRLNTLQDASIITKGSSNLNPNYVFSSVARKKNDISQDVNFKIKHAGNHLVTSIGTGSDMLEIFDSNKTINAATWANGNQSTMSAETYQAFMNGANFGKGTIGFKFGGRLGGYLKTLKVSLNDVTEDTMPVMTDDNLRTVGASSPTITLTVGQAVDLNSVAVQFKDNSVELATDASWVRKDGTSAQKSGNSITAVSKGVTKFEVSYGANTVNIYVIVKEVGAADFYTIKDASPALPMFEKKFVDLNNVIVQFSDGGVVLGSDATWTLTSGASAARLGDKIRTTSKGISTFEVSYGSQKRNIYVVVNEEGNYQFDLVNEIIDSSNYDAGEWKTYYSSYWQTASDTAWAWPRNLMNSHLVSSKSSTDSNGSAIKTEGLYVNARYYRNYIWMYNSSMLEDFADYDINIVVNDNNAKEQDTWRTGFQILTRATLSGTDERLFAENQTSLNFYINRITNGIALYKMKENAAPILTGNLDVTVHSLNDASLLGIDSTDPSYRWEGRLKQDRDIKISLMGNHVTYTLDNNLIFDSNKDINIYTAGGTLEHDAYNAFMDEAYTKGTVGFSVGYMQAYVKAFKVSLNGISVDTMPTMTDAPDAYTVTLNDPVIPMTAGYKLATSSFLVGTKTGLMEGDDFEWSTTADANKLKIVNGTIYAYERGVYTVTAVSGELTQVIYVVVKNPDETEYVLYEKDYRDSANSTNDKVSDWKTVVVDGSGNQVNVVLSGNYNNKVTYRIEGDSATTTPINGFVPFSYQDVWAVVRGNTLDAVSYRTYTTLDNDIIKSLSNYTVSAGIRAYPNARGAVGILGRVTGTVDGKYVPGVSTNAGYASGTTGYGLSGAPYINSKAFFTKNGANMGIAAGVVNDYFYTSINGGSLAGRPLAYRKYKIEFNGGTATLYEPNGESVTNACDISSGTVAIYSAGRDVDANGQYLPMPVLADIKITLSNVDIAHLPYEKIQHTPAAIPSIEIYSDNGNYTFTVTAEGVIGGYKKVDNDTPYSQKVIIPSAVDGVKGSQLEYNMFFNKGTNNTFGEVVISQGITDINENAFRSNRFLEIVSFPNTLQNINKQAFEGTGIIDLVLPSSVTTLGVSAFANNKSMHTLTFGNEETANENIYKSNLTTISASAFANALSLQSVSLPFSLKSLGANAFDGSVHLKSIYIYNKDTIIGNKAIPSGTTIYGYTGSTAQKYAEANGNLFVPWDEQMDAVMAEYQAYLAALEAEIESKSKVEDTNAVYEIYASGDKYGIADVKPSNPAAGKFVFPTVYDYTDVNGTKKVDVTFVKANAFKQSNNKLSLFKVVLPEGYTEIQASAFAGCTNLRYLELPSTLVYIREYAFTSGRNLKNVTIPKNVAYIGQGAFQGDDQLETFTFENFDESVCYYIGAEAFKGTALTEIKLPVHLRRIGTKAFDDTPLKDIYIYNRAAVIGEGAIPAGAVIHGIAGSTAEDYAKANGNTFVADITDGWDAAINKVDPNGKFTYCINEENMYVLESYVGNGKLVIPGEIDYVAEDGTVTKGAVVAGVDNDTFNNALYKHNIFSVQFPESTVIIDDMAFRGCANLVKINIPSSLRKIEAYAFESADIYGELTFGVNCISIGQSAFANNQNLTAVYIKNANCKIGADAFPSTTVIYGVKGSEAEKFAKGNDNLFVEIEAAEFPAISEYKDNGNYTLVGDAATSTVVEYKRNDSTKPYSSLVVFPATINGANMTTIAASLFKAKPYTNSVEAVIIEEGYTTIGIGAFEGTARLVRVQLPSTLTAISNNAFAYSAIAGDLIIPESVTKIGGSAFLACDNLNTITITNPTTIIGPNAFANISGGIIIRGLKGSDVEKYCIKYKSQGIRFESIGEYIDPNAPTGDSENGDSSESDGLKQNQGDVNENKITLFGVEVSNLTLIIIIGIGAMMLLLLLVGVVIVVIVVNQDDDEDEDDDDEDDDEDDDDYEEE